MPTITMKDVARKAGVAQQTVSAILKDENYKVKQSTRERVMRIVNELHYQPNHMARSLRGARKMCIGVAGNSALSNPDLVITRINAGIGEVADQKEYNVLQMPLTQQAFHTRIINASRSKMVDGLILAIYSRQYDAFVQNTIPLLKETDIPFVVLQWSREALPCNRVGFDFEKAGVLATEHLLEQGYRDIMLVDMENAYRNEFYDGYCRTMRAAGRTPRVHRVKNFAFNARQGLAIGRQLLEQDDTPDAVVVDSDFLAYGILEALKQAGKPDIGVVGCGNSVTDDILYSRLTTVDQKLEERGRKAAEMLFDHIEGRKKPGAYDGYVAAPELIVRESSRKTG